MKSRIKQTLVASALVGTLMACGIGYAHTPTKSPALAATHNAKKTPVQLLFVLSARTGRISKTDHGYQLTLNHLDPKVLWFTDRPERKAGLTPLTNFLGGWAKGFAGSPPNAALVHAGMESSVIGKNQPIVLELSKPSYNKGRLTFKIQWKNTQGMAHIDAGEYRFIRLFVDAAGFEWAVFTRSVPFKRR